MKTVRGIFLTTRGHSGIAVPKDCELNEREKDREEKRALPSLAGVSRPPLLLLLLAALLFTRWPADFCPPSIHAIPPSDVG